MDKFQGCLWICFRELENSNIYMCFLSQGVLVYMSFSKLPDPTTVNFQIKVRFNLKCLPNKLLWLEMLLIRFILQGAVASR